MTFRPDIEGLRAVAIVTVLGFHAGVPLFSGGFIGVDVFFVISGYLITALLLSQKRIRLGEFYAQRARRILPAAAVVLVGTAFASWILLPPLRQKDVAWDVISAALNVANWRFVAGQTDYLAAGQAHSPLLHYWSLAVEEQFYLLWAPLLMLFARRRLVIALVTVGSFALSLYWTQVSEPLAYLASPSRAWQFGVGGLLAALVVKSWKPLGAIGLGAIAVATVAFSAQTAFPGWAALVPTLGAAAVIASGPSSAVGRWLSTAPVRWVGRLSFAWYLWHWPVLVLTEARLGELDWPVKLALILASALPAWLTMKLVEVPLHRSRTLAASPRPSLSFGASAVAMPVVIALVLGSTADRSMTTTVTAMPIGAVDGPNLTVNAVAGVYPAPADARVDYPAVGQCQVEPADITSPECLFGEGPDRVVLFGDSHAAQWFPAAQRIAAARGWAVEVLTKSGCPVPMLRVTNPQLGREYRECDEWREYALNRVAAAKPKLILVSSLNRYTSDATQAWQEPLRRLAETGAPVVYLRDTPNPGRDVPTCVSGDLDCDFPREHALWADPGKAVTVGVNDVLCPGEVCPAVLDGVLLYRDDSHLTNTAAALLAARVEKLLVNYGVLG